MKKIITLLSILTLAVCSADNSTTEISKNGIALTPEYLIGKWCHTHDYAQGKIEDENSNWEFKENGMFMQQTSEFNTKMKHKGNWKIEGKKLQIKPTFMGGPHAVTIISHDNFSYKFFVDMHLKRGVCNKQSSEETLSSATEK